MSEQRIDPAQMSIKDYMQVYHPEAMARMKAQNELMQREIEGYRALNNDVAQLNGFAAKFVKTTGSPAADIVSRNLAADAERACIEEWELATATAIKQTGKHIEELTAGDVMAAMNTAQEANKEKPRAIVIDTGDYDPRLDPNAPEFDIEAYRKAIADAGGMEAMTERLKDSFEAVQKQMQETILKAVKDTAPTMGAMLQDTVAQNAEALRGTAAAIVTTAQFALKGIAAFVNSDAYKAIKESITAISAFIAQHSAEIAALSNLAAEIQDIAPFLKMELEEMEKDPAFANATLEDVLERGFDADGNPTDSPFRQMIERARRRKTEFEAAEETITAVEQTAEELPRIIANPTDLLTYPLDKPNSRIWNLLTAADPNGQIGLHIETTSDTDKKKGKEAIINYTLNFDELDSVRLTKQLTPFDKRVYVAAAALLNAGNQIMTATQIHKMMGNRGQPKAEQIEKINESLDKMRAAKVYIDTTHEVEVNKGYTKFVYDGALIEFRRISAYVNNTRTDAAIMLLAEPPLITFAKKRRQITNVPRLLLESPVSKTDANLMIDDYLIERISHMKNNKKLSRKLRFSKIYERCQIKTVKQKQRAPEKIRRYLDYYKKCKFIRGYTEDRDSITIQL